MANQPGTNFPFATTNTTKHTLDILISASNELQARAMELARLDSQSESGDGDDYFHRELKTAIETLATINETIIKVTARGG